MRLWIPALTCFVFLLAGLPAATPDRVQLAPTLDYYLPAGTEYDPAVPTPASVFGFQIGERHLQHHELVDYYRKLDAASDRVTLEEYARSYGGRPLLLLTITSPANHRRLEEIRREHLRLADPSVAAGLDLSRMPAVLNMGYTVHGNEPSGANAAPLVAYWLAAARGPEVDAFLSQLVILLDPCLNPDGLERFAHWANNFRGATPNADPAHREHFEPTPNGRTNYYGFDLNRDWLGLQHPESRGRLRLFHRWRPNVLLDFHEMGTDSTYFFQPGEPGRVHPLTPSANQELTRRLADYHAAALDRLGSLYYTGERYDDFYMGKGSTLPDLHGAIGILFEQASSRGHLQESTSGTFGFPFTIRNQVATSFSSLRATRDLRPELLGHLRDFYRESSALAARHPVQAWVLTAPHDPARLAAFLEVLTGHDIRAHRLPAAVEIGGRTFPAGESLVVLARQPQFRYLLALFETRTTFTENIFYDISTWTLPHAFGLEFAALEQAPDPARLGPPLSPAELALPPAPAATPAAQGHLLDYRGYYAPRALSRLLQAGVRVHVALRPFRHQVGGAERDFPAGTLFLPASLQELPPAQILPLLDRCAREDQVEIFPVQTGLTAAGIDLGSAYFKPLKSGGIALLFGETTSAYESGEIWHLLDARFATPVTLLDHTRLASAPLDRYHTIILGPGSHSRASESGWDKLRAWVRAGGTLVGVQSAASRLVEAKLADAVLRKASPAKNTAGPRPFAEAETDAALNLVSGAIFQASLDLTHPLTFGYTSAELPVFTTYNQFLEPAENPYNTPVRLLSSPLLSGYVSPENLSLAAGSAAAAIYPAGSGRVILFAGNPNFRAFWYGTNRLFLNAVFLGSLMNPAGASPDEEDEAATAQ